MFWTFVVLLLAYLDPTFSDGDGADWYYMGSHGPANWTDDYPHCGGASQSPINIPKELVYDPSLGRVTSLGYDKVNMGMVISNNGHSGILIPLVYV
ncbi:hypothetical protein ScPMuIL_015291 [Solemya velum]